MLVDQSGYRAIVMRLPALFALAALVGLSACDSAKVSELTGAKPATTQIAAACPPAATVAPTCPPAQPAMAPEAAKPAPVVAPGPAAAPAPAAHRVKSHAKARAWAQRHHVRQVKQQRHARAHQPPVRRFNYAGGYTGAAPQGETYVERRHERHYGHPPVYARPDEGYGQHAYRYERREDGYAQDDYRYERRESGHPPYVDERADDRAYRYERREGSMERSGSSSSYESGYSSGGYVSGGYVDDCNCRPQAAGRDRQGFLTWPGKR
jgi:hypothetical protein